MAAVDVVELGCDVRAACPRPDQLEPAPVHLAVGLPELELACAGGVEEQRALQRVIIAGDHRKAVEAQDVSALNAPGRERVVRTVGVETRLKPGPCIHELGLRESLGDFPNHGRGRVKRNFVLRDALAHGLDAGPAADVRDAGPLRDERDLLGGLDHAHSHDGGRHVHELGTGQRHAELGVILDAQVIELDAHPARTRHQLPHGNEVIVPLPVRIRELVSEALAPGLPAIDVGADGGASVLGHHQAVGPSERAVDEISEIVDVVDRGEKRGIDVRLRHERTQVREAAGHLGCGESRGCLATVLDGQRARPLHSRTRRLSSGDRPPAHWDCGSRNRGPAASPPGRSRDRGLSAPRPRP